MTIPPNPDALARLRELARDVGASADHFEIDLLRNFHGVVHLQTVASKLARRVPALLDRLAAAESVVVAAQRWVELIDKEPIDPRGLRPSPPGPDRPIVLARRAFMDALRAARASSGDSGEKPK